MRLYTPLSVHQLVDWPFTFLAFLSFLSIADEKDASNENADNEAGKIVVDITSEFLSNISQADVLERKKLSNEQEIESEESTKKDISNSIEQKIHCSELINLLIEFKAYKHPN